MGRRKVNLVTQGSPTNYGASVPINAASLRKAVSMLKQYNVVDNMFTAVMSPIVYKYMDEWASYTETRPDWIRKLEKEWGIR